MKSDLVKVSLALLSAVFVLGCQDVGWGPVGPDGPQFDKRGKTGALCGGPGEPVRDENGHCHGDEETTGNPRYSVKLTGDIFSVGGDEGFYETIDPTGAVGTAVIVKDDFQMDISFIWDELNCGRDGLGDRPPFPSLTGKGFSLNNFAIPYLILTFDHNRAEHWFTSDSELPDPWPPTTVGDTAVVTQKNPGEWSLNTQGKNHRDGCTGEGPITWRAAVTLLPPPAP